MNPQFRQLPPAIIDAAMMTPLAEKVGLLRYAASVIIGSGLTGILTDSVNSQNAET